MALRIPPTLALVGRERAVVGPPWRFSRSTTGMERWTPALGEHNDYVFGELLGLSGAEQRTLADEKVIY